MSALISPPANRATLHRRVNSDANSARSTLPWVRTALALLAGAVGLMHFAKPLTGIDPDQLFGIVLAAAGLAAIIYATWRWHSVQRAMCHDAPLPGGNAIWFLSGLIILTGSLAGITALVSGGLV